MAEYPEHDKMLAVKDESQPIGEFIEWLYSTGYTIAKYSDIDDDNCWGWPDDRGIEQWLADYFGVDLKVVADEKEAMYQELRAEALAREETNG